jgi:hypothetical protein
MTAFLLKLLAIIVPPHRQKSREAGFDAHVVKPVDPDALTSLLSEFPVVTDPLIAAHTRGPAIAASLVRVCDTGIGIPADRLPVIFELFAQANPEKGLDQAGLGIPTLNCIPSICVRSRGAVATVSQRWWQSKIHIDATRSHLHARPAECETLLRRPANTIAK